MAVTALLAGACTYTSRGALRPSAPSPESRSVSINGAGPLLCGVVPRNAVAALNGVAANGLEEDVADPAEHDIVAAAMAHPDRVVVRVNGRQYRGDAVDSVEEWSQRVWSAITFDGDQLAALDMTHRLIWRLTVRPDKQIDTRHRRAVEFAGAKAGRAGTGEHGSCR
jgi:hypothetical protein